MIEGLSKFLLGGLASILFILYVRNIRKNVKTEFLDYAIGLIIAALIYVGFEIWHMEYSCLSLEVGGVVIYGFLAYLGLRYSIGFLAFGWASHIFWDIMIHMNNTTQFVQDWYPPAYLILDLVLARYIIYRLINNTKVIEKT